MTITFLFSILGWKLSKEKLSYDGVWPELEIGGSVRSGGATHSGGAITAPAVLQVQKATLHSITALAILQVQEADTFHSITACAVLKE